MLTAKRAKESECWAKAKQPEKPYKHQKLSSHVWEAMSHKIT